MMKKTIKGRQCVYFPTLSGINGAFLCHYVLLWWYLSSLQLYSMRLCCLDLSSSKCRTNAIGPRTMHINLTVSLYIWNIILFFANRSVFLPTLLYRNNLLTAHNSLAFLRNLNRLEVEAHFWRFSVFKNSAVFYLYIYIYSSIDCFWNELYDWLILL